MKKPMNFRKAYQMPLNLDFGIVFTKNMQRAFDFPQTYIYKNCIKISDKDKHKVIDCINGDLKKKPNLNLIAKEGIIYGVIDGVEKEFIIVRGWGYLTGVGGLNLSGKKASKIQDDFTNFIVKQLT